MAVVQESSTIGHYRLRERLGVGGMAEVWRAHDDRLGRDVALKLLSEPVLRSPHRRARFEQEARALAALAHPNIVTIHSIEQKDGLHFLAMELVHGRSLDAILAAGALSLPRFLELALPVAEAIAAAHERGVVHGDLKPANVMVSDVGVVKIVDFGLAMLQEPPRTLDPSEISTQEVRPTDLIAGTIHYMAPELLRGRAPDAASDLFALGVMFYEMATGRHPFLARSTMETLASILRDEPTPPRALRADLPVALDRLIRRSLRKDALRRTRRAHEVVEILRDAGRMSIARPERSIAVLPFLSRENEPDQEYFGAGIAEEILGALARVRGLRVAARASSFALGGATDPRDACRQLGVETLLTGTLARNGDRLRISVELIDGGDGCRLWSEDYERASDEVFNLQERIAERVVEKLRGELDPQDRRALRQVATRDIQAYDYYLRGRRFYHQFRRHGMEFALKMYSRAIEVDPRYAHAWAGIAQCSAFLYTTFDRTEEHLRRADEASQRALSLDPQLPESHAARGVALSISNRHAEAERAFETAIRLDPDLYEVPYSWARLAFANGETERAIELYERAAELMPDDYQSTLLVAQIYDDLRRPGDARRARERGIAVVRRRLDLFPDDVRALYMGANALITLGDVAEGLDWAAQARELEPDEPLTLYNLACIYALANETATAIDCLAHAVELGFADGDWLRHDSNLDALRKEPRFVELLREMPTA